MTCQQYLRSVLDAIEEMNHLIQDNMMKVYYPGTNSDGVRMAMKRLDPGLRKHPEPQPEAKQ